MTISKKELFEMYLKNNPEEKKKLEEKDRKELEKLKEDTHDRRD